MAQVSKKQIQEARISNLYRFCINNHADLFDVESNTIRFRLNHSISIKDGYSGYLDFATGEKGNSVDFLTKYLNYSFTNAVCVLIGNEYIYGNEKEKRHDLTPKEKASQIKCNASNFSLPEKNITVKNIVAYLNQTRKISKSTIDRLIYLELLYQDQRNNCVFVNYDKDYAELRGTNTYIPFHGLVRNSRHDGYWSYDLQQFKGGSVNIFICESAIDAISLFELHNLAKFAFLNVAYVSIGGVQKQSAIDRLKVGHRVYICVDNDEAGHICRTNNNDLQYIKPIYKDWNEDLVKYRQGYNHFDLTYTNPF